MGAVLLKTARSAIPMMLTPLKDELYEAKLLRAGLLSVGGCGPLSAANCNGMLLLCGWLSTAPWVGAGCCSYSSFLSPLSRGWC